MKQLRISSPEYRSASACPRLRKAHIAVIPAVANAPRALQSSAGIQEPQLGCGPWMPGLAVLARDSYAMARIRP